MNPYRLIAKFYDVYLDESLYQDILSLVQHEKTSGYALDLATGTGQMALTLANNHFTVDATDISLDMLQQAEQLVQNTGVPIKLYVHNILEPISADKYDVVTLASDVVNHLSSIEEVATVFAHIGNALDVGGVFVFDALHQEYATKLIGYRDLLKADSKELHWTVIKEHDTAIKHLLKVDDEEASLIQYIYPEEVLTEHLLRHKLMVIEKIRTSERTIFLTKKSL